MSIASWLYDHAPKPVQEWMENRTIQKEAEQRYPTQLEEAFKQVSTMHERAPVVAQPDGDVILANEITKQMGTLSFDYNEREMRQIFEREAAKGIAPVITAKEFERALRVHEAKRDIAQQTLDRGDEISRGLHL